MPEKKITSQREEIMRLIEKSRETSHKSKQEDMRHNVRKTARVLGIKPASQYGDDS